MPQDASAAGRRGVVAVVVRDHRLLLVRRSQTVVAPGAYCFPGGAVETGESEPEALAREIREELGARVVPVRRLWESVAPWGVRLAWWLCDLPAGEALTPNPSEVESARWCSPAEMAGLGGLLESNRAFLEALAAGRIGLEV
jgi:8-oxo-dGTP pyrophosphatase MutT (NUDIX family)